MTQDRTLFGIALMLAFCVLAPWHFGIGTAGAAEVRVIWPDGAASEWVQARPGEAVEIGR